MSKVLIKQEKPSMVLVKKGVAAQYPLGAGGPILVAGGGGRGGGAPRGRTKRERVGSALGATAGALGALTGQHRSLGGLVQGAISGGAQGASLGGGLGRKLSGRSSRALADVKEGEKQARSKQHAEQGTGLNRVTAPVDSRNRRVGVRHADELARVNRANAAATAPSLAAGQKFQQSAEKFQQARGKMGTEGEWKQRGQSHDWVQQQADAFGISREKYMQSVGPFMSAAAEQGGRIDPDWEGGQMGNVDAAGKPLSPQLMIGQGAIPLPSSNPGDTAAGENARMDQMGNQFLTTTGTDTERAKTVQPGPEEGPMYSGQTTESNENFRSIMADMARGTNSVQGQASAMNEPSDDEKKYNVQPTLGQF